MATVAVRRALESQARRMLPVVEAELKRQVRRMAGATTAPFHEILRYHMGWTANVSGRQGGKRVRPLLMLLVCGSLGSDWRKAAPAAAALELLHNFSLVHDDIQDNSPTRRGRPTLWKKVGAPLAINAGDALFTIAAQAALDLSRNYEPRLVLASSSILQQACLDLTKGQFLDLHHQKQHKPSLRAYWQMIDGKTGALLAAATHLGALLGGAGAAKCREYRKFGALLGRAFQVEDDVLGIWGEEKSTGKSASTDLAEGKLSLPVVYALNARGPFAALWRDAGGRARNSARLRRLLEDAGAREYAFKEAARLTRAAAAQLERMRPKGQAGQALRELCFELLLRKT